jgi:hypothetical protein
MFSVHAFLFVTNADLQEVEKGLSAIFDHEAAAPAPTLSHEANPFTGEAYLLYRWADWSISVTADRGVDIEEDVKAVRSVVGGAFPDAHPRGRIRIVFANDETLEYTNHVLWIMDYLREIPGVVIYDESEKSLWT